VSGPDARHSDLNVLVGRAQSGHTESLNRLLRLLQIPLFNHIESLTRDSDIAEDVLQSTFWTIARKIRQLRDPRLFRAWSYRIATRLAVRAAQKERAWQRDRTDLLDSLPSEAPFEPPPDVVDAVVIEGLLDGLSEASAIAIRMRYVDDLSYLEIAEALDIPLGTVKSRIAYGIRVMRSRAAVRAQDR
jgi:RNA polymerase sigma-70 factor (ECF subfamily)